MASQESDRFSRAVVQTLAKRAANTCSNPDCVAITSGPAEDRSSSINVGEAAHIYGAKPGSARYLDNMSSASRSDITNAIWLCGNCHKMIDDDAGGFPAGLLFEWQREHEQRVLENIGKAGAELRQRYYKRHLEELGKLSYLSERIILEKPPYWEFRLTAEIIRFETLSIFRRWRALKKGLYSRLSSIVAGAEFLTWVQARTGEATRICTAFEGLINEEFMPAWGEPGVPGSEETIVEVCRLYRELCEAMLLWEETVRFTTVHSAFRPVRDQLMGTLDNMFDEAVRFPAELGETFKEGAEPTEFVVNIKLSLPEGWGDRLLLAMERAEQEFIEQLN